MLQRSFVFFLLAGFTLVLSAPLLIAAYAVVWIVLAVYVWTLWRRFLRAEQDLKQLAGRLPPAR